MTWRALGQEPKTPRRAGQHVGHQTLARFTRECWSKPRALGHGPEWPGTAGRHRGPSHKRQSPGTAGRPHGPSDPSAIHPGELVEPRALGHRPELPGTEGRHLGPSDQDPSCVGQQADHARSRAWARVTQEGWSTPQALQPDPESPGAAVLTSRALGTGPELRWRACQPRKVSGTGPGHPGQLVDTVGPQKQA